MATIALDHVNIVTNRLDETCTFYSDLFGLERRNGPMQLPADKVQWLHNREGQAIFHINSESFTGGQPAAANGPMSTGPIDHVALACSDLDDMLRRLDMLEVPYRTVRFDMIGLTQVFVSDPNGVMLELGFRDDPA